MAQVRKYQSGGVTTNDNLLIDIGGIKYLKSDIVGIFKNQSLRDSYSKEFLGNDAEQDALFNKIADIYADGLDSGKMRFDSDGRHILDPSGKYYNIDKIIDNPKTQQDYFNNQSVRVMNMFEIAKRKGYIRSWESAVNNKDAYSFDEKKIVTTNYFNKPYDYDWSELAPAWFALDSMDDKTKIRKSENRRKILSKVILKEADKIDNDPAYRKRYKFDNEINNPLAYKEYTKAMREYAEMIANSDNFNESMLEVGVKLGTNPKLLYQQTDKDTDSLFANITQEALQAQADAEKKKQEDADAAKKAADDKAKQDAENLVKDVEANGVIRNIDPLSTTDISFVENNGIYYITDNISNISPFGQQLANTLQARYGREQIQKNWYGWQQYAGRYLENLTNYFTNKTGYRIYAMTYGPLSHSKKIFFAKKPSDKKPTQIKFKKVGVDYHIFDTKGKELANLGSYCYDSVRRTIQSNADYEAVLGILMPTPLSKDYDTGEPIPFQSKEVFTKDGMNIYWKMLTQLKYDEYDARRFEEILKGVSMQFLSLPEQDQYKYNAFNVSSNPKSWHGSRFALYVNNAGHVVFSWIYGKNELAFVSKVTREEFIKKYLKQKGNVRYIDSGFINSVSPQVFDITNGNNIDIIGYKHGGKFRKHSQGGSLLDTYKAQVELGLIQNPVEMQQVSIIPQQQNTEQAPEQQLAKQPEEFTVADGVRLGASILDLAGAFMLFPKGLNMASAAVSGASLVGYIGADLADVIAGKKELWPTLKHDAEIAGVQAIALVNPVKAGQIAPALAKIVPMIPHIAGLLWTYDILADDYSRKSIMGTLDKIQKMKVSEINSQDLTNLAFIARTLIGAKMGGKAIKNKVSKGVKKITNKSLQVDDVPYQVKIKNEANPNETILRSDILQVRKGSGKQRQSDKIADIKKQVVEDYNSKLKEGEQKVTIEDVEILDAPNGNPIPATRQTYKFNFKDPVDIMSESWAPGRLFETAVQHGSFKDGYVTRESTWLGKQLRDALGEDFDVWFSDEALYRNKQEQAVNALAHNLFGGINEIKNLAQKVAQLKESEAFKQATDVQQEQIMSDFLAKNGYLYKPETVQESQIYEGALNKANEIVEVANNLNSMTDVEAASRILGVDNIDTATRWEGNSPENYVTSEMLRKAYNLFKEVYNSNSPIAQAARVSDTQMLVENFADQFNGRPLESAWKQNGELIGIIQTNLTKFQNIANRVDRTFKERYEAINNPTEQRAFILSEARKLLDSGKLSQSDYELIQNTQNLIRNSKAEDIFRKTTTEEPSASRSAEESKSTETPKTEPPTVEGPIIEEVKPEIKKPAKSIKRQYPAKSKKVKTKGKQKKNVKSKKEGGIMDFVNSVLISRLQAGGYLKVGKNFSSAIQPNFNDPYGQGWNEYVGSWYNQIGSRQLPGMLDLLAQNEDWLGDNGIIAQLNRDKASLDTSWDANHKANNGAYWGTNVGDYQRRISFDPITTAISNAYSSGRYMLRTNNPSSGEYKLKDDNLFSAVTHDAVAFGNVKWLSDQHKQNYLKLLKSSVGDKYKFVADQNGYIYPVAATQTELGDGESWFYTNDTVNDDGTLITTNPQDASVAGSTDASSKESTQTSGTKPEGTGDGDKSKEDPAGDGTDHGRSGSDPNGDILPKLSKNPNTNKNWIDLAILAAGELGTIDARNQIKFRFTPQQTYNLVDRVRTGNNAQRTTQEYSSLFSSAPTSSDARYNAAVRLNIGTNYVKALQDAFDKDRTVFYDSYTKAQQTQQDNIKRQYETYNANLKDYTDQLKYQDNINYMERQKLWQNVSNYLTTKATDIENANKLKTSKYYQVYSNKIEQQRAQTINEIKLSYWQNLSDEEKKKYGNSMSTYLSSQDFRTAHGDEYDEKIRKANEIADKNTEALIEGIYSVNPKDITYQKTYGSSLKNGGQIIMAKKGSNLNWAKIENARMVNKSINESIKETYKSIRSANRELQKTIRALAPMLKALNT